MSAVAVRVLPVPPMSLSDTKISVLDLATYSEGGTVADAFVNTRNLAQLAEARGYHRFWLAEHHNIDGVASAATAVLVGHVAGLTKRIRVGSGGIMLPNHAPLMIAEQFGTLATLYPGRIDLGLGRAPGTDQMTMRALRRGLAQQDFAELMEELIAWFEPASREQRLRAIPGEGVDVPMWILGSSLYSAQLAALLGRPYAFAGHFAPAMMLEAFEIYRSQFKPSEVLDKPLTMAGVSIVAAETDQRARFLATSAYRRYLGIVRGHRSATPPPVESMDGLWTPSEEYSVRSMTEAIIVGGPAAVKEGLERYQRQTRADELIVMTAMFDPADTLKSYEIVADVAGLPRSP